MNLILLLLLPFIYQGRSSSPIQTFEVLEKHTQSGLAYLVSDTYFSALTQYQVFTILYTTPFKNIPQTIIALNEIVNTPTDGKHMVDALSNLVQSTTTKYEFTSTLGSYSENNHKLGYRYFSLDPLVIPNVEIVTTLYQATSNTSAIVMPLAQSHPSGSVSLCFFLSVSDVVVNNLPFYFNIRANNSNNNGQITCYFTTNGDLSPPSTFYQVRVAGIVMSQLQNEYRILHGSISYENGVSQRVQLPQLREVYCQLFAGLTRFSLSNSSISLALNEDLEIISMTNIVNVQYKFLQLVYLAPAFISISLSPIKNKFALTFDSPLNASSQLSNFSINANEPSLIDNKIQATISESLSTQYLFQYTTSSPIKQIKSTVRFIITAVDAMEVDVHKLELKVTLRNTLETATITIPQSYNIRIRSQEYSNHSTILSLTYSAQQIGSQFEVVYYNPIDRYFSYIQLEVPYLQRIATSFMTFGSWLEILSFKHYVPSTPQNFSLGQEMEILQVMKDDPLSTSVKINYISSTQISQQIAPLALKQNLGQYLTVKWNALNTILSLTLQQDSQSFNITLSNIPNITGVGFNDFTLSSSSFTISKIILNQSEIILTITKPLGVSQHLTIQYRPKGYGYSILFQNAIIPSISQILFSEDQLNQFMLHFEQPELYRDTHLGSITFSHREIEIIDKRVENDVLVLVCNITELLSEQHKLELYFRSTHNHYNIIYSLHNSIKIQYRQPLPPPPPPPQPSIIDNTVLYLSWTILGLYFLAFVILIIRRRVIDAIQLMRIPQYASLLLPLSYNEFPLFFDHISPLQYSHGYNPLKLFGSNRLPENYSMFGIHSSFFNNINIMLFILAVCFIIFTILRLVIWKATTPLLTVRQWAIYFLIQIPIAILKFSLVNIYYAFFINKATNSEDIITFAFSIVVIAALPIYTGVFLFAKNYFGIPSIESDEMWVTQTKWEQIYYCLVIFQGIAIITCMSLASATLLPTILCAFVVQTLLPFCLSGFIRCRKQVQLMIHSVIITLLITLTMVNRQLEGETRFQFYSLSVLGILLIGLVNTLVYVIRQERNASQPSIQILKNRSDQLPSNDSKQNINDPNNANLPNNPYQFTRIDMMDKRLQG